MTSCTTITDHDRWRENPLAPERDPGEWLETIAERDRIERVALDLYHAAERRAPG